MNQEDQAGDKKNVKKGKPSDMVSPVGGGDKNKEQDFQKAKQMQMQNMLAYEMKKIDESIKEGKLSDYQKVKRQVREAKGTDKDVV